MGNKRLVLPFIRILYRPGVAERAPEVVFTFPQCHPITWNTRYETLQWNMHHGGSKRQET